MAAIDPMYNLVNTILDEKEVVFLLGSDASMEGEQNGERFPSLDELMDRILKKYGIDSKKKEKRFELFLSILEKWEKEKQLSVRMGEFLDGEPGLAHYYLAAFSVALFGKSNALLYLTTNYDDLIAKAFSDLERNPERNFRTIPLSLRSNITGSEFIEMVDNINGHLRKGQPVILKLFGDLNFQSPIFKQEDMLFEPAIEDKLIEWMKRPMVIIGYNFPDKIIMELLISARSTSPIFLVNPSPKIPSAMKNLERMLQIKNDFSGFISDLTRILSERDPSIGKKIDKILEIRGVLPKINNLQTEKDIAKSSQISPITAPKKVFDIQREEYYNHLKEFHTPMESVQKILILAANPKDTSRLLLDEEVREIEEGLRGAKHRDRFEISSVWAVRLRDIRRALLDFEPNIVHFIGHGEENGLLTEDEVGFPVRISAKTLSGLFELFSNRIECVILSACYSIPQAMAISKHINYVIGMRREINDKAAIEFSVGFYDALSAGKTVEEAFKFGCSALRMMSVSDHLIPVLKKRST